MQSESKRLAYGYFLLHEADDSVGDSYREPRHPIREAIHKVNPESETEEFPRKNSVLAIGLLSNLDIKKRQAKSN